MELEILQSINISNRKALSASTSTFNLDNQQQQSTTTINNNNNIDKPGTGTIREALAAWQLRVGLQAWSSRVWSAASRIRLSF